MSSFPAAGAMEAVCLFNPGSGSVFPQAAIAERLSSLPLASSGKPGLVKLSEWAVWRDQASWKGLVVCAVTFEPVSDSTMGINRANSRIRAFSLIPLYELTCAASVLLKIPVQAAREFFNRRREFVWT
jgi:hypothetical protein